MMTDSITVMLVKGRILWMLNEYSRSRMLCTGLDPIIDNDFVNVEDDIF